MNAQIETILNHRSIREFKPEPLPQETLDLLMDVALRTATSNGLQTSSIVIIEDQELKNKIAHLANQPYIERIPLLLIFVADQYRNHEIAQAKGVDASNLGDMDRFFQAFTDTCIQAQNVVNAAESLGLGTFYIGSIQNDPSQMIELLNLPPYTLPIVGLGIGIPAQDPQLKPRLGKELRVFKNVYPTYPDILSQLKVYDEAMTHYYDLRNVNRRLDSFSDQVANKSQQRHALRADILSIMKAQGFKVD